MNIYDAVGPAGWAIIRRKILSGEHPNIEDLASKLRGDQPAPPEVREYIAGLLEGSIKQKRGRKPDKFNSTNAFRRIYLASEVTSLEDEFKKNNHPAPHQAALKKVSQEFNVPVDTLKKWANPPKRGRITNRERRELVDRVRDLERELIGKGYDQDDARYEALMQVSRESGRHYPDLDRWAYPPDK